MLLDHFIFAQQAKDKVQMTDSVSTSDAFNCLPKVLQQCINLTSHQYNTFLCGMVATAIVVFIALFFVKAGYGKFQTKSWGPTISNKLSWFLMESPVFFTLLFMWSIASNERKYNVIYIIFLLIFETHYFQRSFIFPFLLKGKGRMPITIMLLATVFNVLNGYMQGEWLFFVSPNDYYQDWFTKPVFYLGVCIFFVGMFINCNSDHIIRHLRKPGDNKHYLPNKGLYKYVTSANYLGEIIEWIGFALLTWSPSGVVFVIWTFANLFPRAVSIYNLYIKEFGDIVKTKKIIIPFIL